MTIFKPAAEIWRDYATSGVPASGPHQPDKREIRTLLTFLETLLNGGMPSLSYADLASLNDDLAHNDKVTALVYNDATAANNGMYAKSGNSGVGSWVRIGDLPNAIVRLTVTGGTANAIVATATETPTVPGSKLFLMTPTAANLVGGVTVSLNAGALTGALKDAFGNDPAAGALQNGSQVLMAWSVDHFQLLISANVDASGVLAAALAAQTAAQGYATNAAASAAALGNQVHQYDTRAQAAAATIPVGVVAIKVTRRAVGYPLSYATYIPGTNTGPDSFAEAGGHYWELDITGNYADVDWFGAAGNGTTDDRASIQAGIDALASRGGGTLVFAPNKTYRAVINSGVTDLGLIAKSGVTLAVNNATINLECTGSVYGIRLQSDSHGVGPGTVKVSVSSGPGGAGIYHVPFSVGCNYGEVTSVGAIGNYLNASNWSVRNLTLDSVRSGGYAAFSAVGGGAHGLIEDIVIPDNSTCAVAIGADWGTVGAISSFDCPASRALWDAGTAYSVHPHDITIRRIKIGNLTAANVIGIRLSGCYKIKITDVEITSVAGAGFFHTGGDLAFEFAQASPNVQRWAYRGTTITNFHVYDHLTGVGFYYESFGDNLAAAIAGGYASIGPAIYNTDVVFENCRAWSTAGTSAGRGFWFQFMVGGTLRNCFSELASIGVHVEGGVDELKIEGGEFAFSQQSNINVGNADSPQDISIIGAKLYNGGQSGSGFAGVELGICTRPRIERCIFGTRGGDSTQSYGVKESASAVAAIVRDNNVIGVKSGGAGLSLAGSNSYASVDIVSGNSFDASVTTKMIGVDIIPFAVMNSPAGDRARHWTARRAVATTAPTSGAWVAGDTIFYADPITGSFLGIVCVSAGAQGTWKSFGATT